MRVEPDWLPVKEVVELNKAAVAETGEPFGIRDEGLLRSAIDRPEHHWYYDGEDDILVLAIKLMLGIARNHPFIQGNKRTGFDAARMFLRLNGYRLTVGDTDDFGAILVQVITGDMLESRFVEIMHEYVAPL